MKKEYILSIIAIIVSIIALCVVCVRNSALDIDWYGVLIGILSLLVTVLIGWNIYSYIKIENDIKKNVDNQIIEHNRRLDDKIKEYELLVSDTENKVISLTFYTIGEDMFRRKDPLLAIDYLSRAIIALNQLKDPPEFEMDKTLSSIENVLSVVNQTKIDLKNIGWTLEYADFYISEVSKIKDNRIKPLLEFLYIVRVIISANT